MTKPLIPASVIRFVLNYRPPQNKNAASDKATNQVPKAAIDRTQRGASDSILALETSGAK